ncbi:MAG TPA: hypothetical protein VGP68_11965 [Gemmataceae bacterium]|jgi:hypothetical protein|nr:hypothetical protein [Gemmataceae bacterium]
MRKRMAWALATGLAIGMVASSVQADDDPPPPPKPQPTGGWVGPFKDWNKPAPKPDAKKKDPAAPHKLTIAEQVQAARFREQADLLRRMAVCDKLMEIAVRNNDADLIRRVEQLQERANNVYTEHAATLAQAVDGANGASSMAMADRNKLLEKKDAAPVVAAKGDAP